MHADAGLDGHGRVRRASRRLHVAGREQRHRKRRARVDTIEIEFESCVDRVGFAKIRNRFRAAVLRLAQAGAFRKRGGPHGFAPRQQYLRQKPFRAAQVTERSQFARDEHARPLQGDAGSVLALRAAQVFERARVLIELGGGVAREPKRRYVVGLVAGAFIHRQRAFDGDPCALDVAAAELDRRQRGELARLAALVTARGEQLQCFGVQHQCAVEISQRDECGTQVADQRRVRFGIAIAVDQRKQFIEHRDGLRHVSLASGDECEALGRPHLEQLVATLPGPGENGAIDRRGPLVIAQHLFASAARIECGDRVRVHFVRFEKDLRVEYAKDGGVEHCALVVARNVRAHRRSQAELVERAQDRGARLPGCITRRREVRLRGFGGPAAIGKLVQQVELDRAAFVFAFRQRLQVVCRFEVERRLAQWCEGGAPRGAIASRQQHVGLAERLVAEQALVRRRVRRRLWPAQDADRCRTAPVTLVGAGQRDADRGRLREANYNAVQPVPQVGVREVGVLLAGVDANAQVDVALADLDQVLAFAQLPAERLRL